MELLSLQNKSAENFKCPGAPLGKIQEWHPDKRWNPFNSYKLLAHVHRWSQIKRGRSIPPPILITIDPTNACNFACEWCNAEFIRRKRKNSLTATALLKIADFLPKWGQDNPNWEAGVKAVCIAGGGEPLFNSATALFIDNIISRGIEVGLVTNGAFIDSYIDAISYCTWVGISVDAATSKTFNKLKGLSPQKKSFERVIDNIATLVDYSKRHHSTLGLNHPSYGVSFKFLLYNKENIGEMFKATKLAKEIGCKNIHFRPAGTTWDKLETEDEIKFSRTDIALFEEQIKRCLELNDEHFGVYGVTHKFTSQFKRANYFDKCYAIFMTAVIEPPSGKDSHEDSFILGLCCDRRGDKNLELAHDILEPNQINDLWGSKQHWQVLDDINVRMDCPRCTYQPHNEIYEQVILNDSMTYKFI